MKPKVLLAALAGMILASCTNDEQMFDVAKKGNEIRFAVASQTPQVRAEHDKDGAFTDTLRVWAWRAGCDEVIIDGVNYHAGSNTFEGNKMYYYPTDGCDVDFLVVPLTAINEGYFTAPVRKADGTTNYTFSVGHTGHSNKEHQTDLMTSEIITQKAGVVGVVLRHLTAKLNLRVLQIQKQNEASTVVVTLKKIEFKNLRNHGHVELTQAWSAVNGGSDCSWTTISNDNPCSWVAYESATGFALASHIVSENNKNFESKGDFYVVPQDLVDGADGQTLVLKYNVETKYNNNQPTVSQDFTTEIELNDFISASTAPITSWAMNKNVTYIVSINPVKDSHKITFDVEVEAWGNVMGDAPIIPTTPNN